MNSRQKHLVLRALAVMPIAIACSACGPSEADLGTASEVATIAPVSPTLTPAITQTSTNTPSNIPAPTHTPIGGGEKIAFASNRDGNFEIYMMKPDGSEQRRLTHLDENNYAPEFSPDGEIILFMAVDLETDPPIAEIQFIRTDGTGWGVLGYGAGSVSWSPISDEQTNQRAITFRSLDEAVLDELAVHLEVLGYEFKRYMQSPGEDKQKQHMLRIHKQDEVRRFCEEVGFRRVDRARRANEFLANWSSLGT